MAVSSLSQSQLDALVAERLHWAARFASSVAHDLGNLVLFSQAPAAGDAEMPESLRACRQAQADLIAHIRQMLSKMALWRHPEAGGPQLLSPKAWWSAHGGMVRQFVGPDARVVLVNGSNDAPVEAARLARIISGMLVAIDLQVQELAKVAITIEAAADGGALNLKFAVSPRIGIRLILPTTVTANLRGSAYGTDGGVEYLTLSIGSDASAPRPAP